MKPSSIITTILLSSISAVPALADEYWDIRGTTSSARPDLAGTVLVDQVRRFQGFDSTGATFKGTFQDRVVRRSVSGTLDFYYKITLDSASTASISRVVRSGFDEVPMGSHDVAWRVDGLGTVGPSMAHRAAQCCIETIFGAAGGLNPGKESRFVFIGTGATQYDAKGVINIFPIAPAGDRSVFVMTGFAPAT